MMKNGILTFIFAFCPGAGQMYQGYMKRGLSLITMFYLSIVIGVSTLEVLTVGCVIVWMYSFFDTFNLRAQIGAGTAPEDDYLVHINWKDQRMQEFMMDSHKLLGWGLIVLGALVAYQNILMNTLGDIVWRWGQSSPFFRALYLMMDQLPEIVVCVALIICGAWLVRGPKGKKVHRKKAEEPEDEDFCEYTAAEADAPEAPEETIPDSAPSDAASVQTPVTDAPSTGAEQSAPERPAVQTGWTENVTLDGADGVIHYSYYLPSSYDGAKTYPLVVTMPGYDRMWFGADSAGTNLSWNGVQAWTKLDTEVIVVSAQLTDWGDTSARQANELAEYMIENFSVDTSRVYAAGYSAGGETMSRAVAMRPDLYAAYIHGGSQWDGAFDTVAENRVAVYIFMAEHDEYYGSQKARDAYAGLHDAYAAEGLTEAEIDALLKLEIPDDAYFNDRGIYNYHGGGSVVFDDTAVLNWILEQSK